MAVILNSSSGVGESMSVKLGLLSGSVATDDVATCAIHRVASLAFHAALTHHIRTLHTSQQRQATAHVNGRCR